jgi:pimeloyl-ACP methyl ester carboxylesterase
MTEELRVPVAGGDLHAWRSGEGPVVVLVHGITANRKSWAKVVRALEQEATVVVPDLRGRGKSNALPPPYGMTAHADDIVAVLDHIGCERAVLAGHSMGGWVVTTTATRYPERVKRLVIIDGGASFAIPEGAEISVEATLNAVLGPSMQRLAMKFPTRDAYVEYWQAHPAVGGRYWDDDARAYVEYDLVGTEPELHSCVLTEAVIGDATEQLTVPEVQHAIESLPCPAIFLRAERGLLDGDPLYSDAMVDALRPRWKTVESVETVPDTNHFTIVLGDGAPVVAERIREALKA